MPDNDKDPKVAVKSKTGASLLPAIREQFKFIQDYTNSPKYKERLTKMVNAERNLQGAINPNARFTNEVMSGSRVNTPTPQVVQNVVDMNNQNLTDIGQGNISVIGESLGTNVAGGFDSSMGDARLVEDLTRANPSVPAHEFSHGANDGRQPYSPAFDEKYLKKVFIPATNSRFQGEVQKPTEVKARLDAIRYLGSKKGIYDAGKSDFTPADYDKMIQDKEIKNDYNFKQILDQLPSDRKKTGFIWLMNNIAKVKGDDADSNMA